MLHKSFIRILTGGLIMLMSVAIYAQKGQETLKSIAVMEFEAKGVTQLEASTLTDRFRSELVRTNVFTQIERNKIEQIFKEQKLQLSGTVSDDKLVEIGELLGAELLVVGSIGKLGTTYTIDLRLVDVQSGKILASYFKDYRGAVDGLLGVFRIIAQEIAGKDLETSASQETGEHAVVSNTVTTNVQMDLSNIRQQAKKDAKKDLSALAWGAGGAASGTVGSCLYGPLGGGLGVGGAIGAAYLINADPPPERLEALGTSDPLVQQTYREAYQAQLKHSRATWGGSAGTLGCCVITTLLIMALTGTTY